MSDEDPPAYARRLRADARSDRAIDGGAVAAGLCPSVLAVFLSIAGPTPGSVSLGITTTCLLCGGILAGYLSRPGASGGVQGVAVVVLTAGLMLAVAASTALADGSSLRVPLVFAYDALALPSFALLLVLAGAFGGLAGEVGTRLRS
jgi:hypothetical protein